MKKAISTTLVAAMLSVTLLSGCGNSTSSAVPAAASSNPAESTTSSAAADTVTPEFTFRYAENQPQDYPTTKAAYKFADLVNQKTNGRIKIEVYYGGQLGDEKSVIEQLQFGAIDFTRVSLSPLAEFSKQLNVLQLPYLYTNSEQMWKVLDGEIGNQFKNGLEDAKMVGLSWFDAGARNFYNSKREVKSPDDLKGLKIRVQESNLMMGMLKALGADPTPMSYNEVYSSLQTGVIDGAENNWPSYESTSHYEVAKYICTDEHTRVPELQMVSKATMDKLSADDQKIIKECATESAKNERELWAEREKTSLKKIKEGGSIITELTDEQRQKFADACKPLYIKYAADYKDIVAKIQATK